MERNCEREEFANTLECVEQVCPDRIFEEAPGFWVCGSGVATTTTVEAPEVLPYTGSVTAGLLPVSLLLVATGVMLLRFLSE